MRETSIGLAGAGYWGSKLARNIFEADGCRLSAVADPDPERCQAAVERYPGTVPIGSVEELVDSGDVEAVILATPASQHAEHIRLALQSGKHVMVEKPLALSVADAEECRALAESTGLKLMVGHTFLYSEPVRILRELIVSGELGRVLYVYAQRLNLGVIRQDLNALWNFGPHDISILLYLLGAFPERVSARSFSVLDHGLEDVAFMVLEFPGGVVGHVHESWIDPRKVRQFTVVGDKKMVVYDDTQVDEPLAIYDKGVTKGDRGMAEFSPEAPEGFGESKLQVRAGDLVVPRVVGREPLRVEIEHFAECVQTGATPLTDAAHGRDVVAVLEAAERSARQNGEAVPVQEMVSAHTAA